MLKPLLAALCVVCFALPAEARPRPVDPFTAFVRAFTPQPVRHVRKQRPRQLHTAYAPSKPVPSITVHPPVKDGQLMPGAADKFDPPMAEVYKYPITPPADWTEKGVASWYGPGFSGRLTACGNVYNEWAMVAAHKSLKCGTVVEVHSGGKFVTVVIRDRGPYVRGRIIDLSKAAASKLGMLGSGTAPVTLYVLAKDIP